MTGPEERHYENDELLELLWHLNESHDLTIESLREHDTHKKFEVLLDQFSADDLLRVDGNKIVMTDKGDRSAKAIVRRHRLAERLVVDVLGKTPEETETAACEFEHVLAPEVVESICTLLGHPNTCPHGKQIPPGDCCLSAAQSVKSLISTLNEMEPGQVAKIASVNSSNKIRVTRLLSLGVSPGSYLKLHQKSPTLVIEVNHTQIAIENDIGDDIHVWRTP
jgi:DtxR family Mn-dependent transcriptional regulator